MAKKTNVQRATGGVIDEMKAMAHPHVEDWRDNARLAIADALAQYDIRERVVGELSRILGAEVTRIAEIRARMLIEPIVEEELASAFNGGSAWRRALRKAARGALESLAQQGAERAVNSARYDSRLRAAAKEDVLDLLTKATSSKRRGPKPMIAVPTDRAALDALADEILAKAPGVRITRPRALGRVAGSKG